MARKRIGELLLERGAISAQQLEAGLAAQRRTRQRLGVTLIAQGLISEVQLAQVLAQSLSLGTVDLNQANIDWSAVHMLRDRFCEQHELFPFAIDGKGTQHRRLLVAMSDPMNQSAIDEIEFTTGLKVTPYVSTHSQLRSAIVRYYRKGAEGPPKQVATQDEDPPMVLGEAIDPSGPKPRSTSMTKDLDFLFGQEGEESADDRQDRRFWALLRILQRKGLLTRDEFMAELEREG